MTREATDPQVERARVEAHDWIARMHGPDAAASADTFQAWLDASPANAQIYRDLQAHWERAKFLTHTKTGQTRDLSSVAVWHRRAGARWAIAAMAIVILASGLAFSHFALRPTASSTIAYSTRVGEIRTVALTDGSNVTLDAASSMQVSMTDAAREVRLLDGSARFDVKPDPARMFSVLTTGGTVTTTGGTFDVTKTPDFVRVTSLKATLNFKSQQIAPGRGSAASSAINPGQRLSVTGQQPAELANAPQTGAQDWTMGMLSFDGERLSDAVRELNRHNARKIVLADAALAGLRITGAFHANDPDGFARSIAAMLGLTRQDRNGVIALGRKK